jgi:hypothetical protein
MRSIAWGTKRGPQWRRSWKNVMQGGAIRSRLCQHSRWHSGSTGHLPTWAAWLRQSNITPAQMENRHHHRMRLLGWWGCHICRTAQILTIGIRGRLTILARAHKGTQVRP